MAAAEISLTPRVETENLLQSTGENDPVADIDRGVFLAVVGLSDPLLMEHSLFNLDPACFPLEETGVRSCIVGKGGLDPENPVTLIDDIGRLRNGSSS
jgi:hypothetical protein